jgi:hypothetical protein
MNKNIFLLFKAVIGIMLLVTLCSWIDWRAGLQALQKVNILYLSLTVVLFPLTLIIASCRWMVLLRQNGIHISLLEALKIYWIGIYLSNFLPSNIGGDLSRAGLLYRFNKMAQVAGSIFAERFLGLIALLILVLFSTLMHPKIFISIGGVTLVWIGLLSFFIIIFVFFSFLEKINFYFLDREDNSKLSKLFKKIGKVLFALKNYDTRIILKVLFLSFLYYFIAFIAQFFIAKSIGLNIGFLSIAFVAPLIWLVSMLPISINAIGLAEGAFVVFYPQVGLSLPEALAFALLLRFVQMLCSGVGGFLLFNVDLKSRKLI